MRVFLNHDAVQFVAGRIFPHGGRKYYPGDVVEDARSWPNLESAVRAKHLHAVVDVDLDELPLQIRKEVKPRSQVLEKVRAHQYTDAERFTPEPEPEVEELETPDFPALTIREIRAYLDLHPEETFTVLEREQASEKPRPRLIKELEERLTAPEETIDV